jgi:hypothetical protein
MKLKEATQVPVPTLIGLTHGEVLLEGRVEGRILVNVDLKMVIDTPSLDVASPHRFKIIETQLAFHRQAASILAGFQGCPGFPHKPIQSLIGAFIFQYLRIFTGQVVTSDQFISQLSRLPEYLESSQVMQDLLHLADAPPHVKRRFTLWLADAFPPKGARSARPAVLGAAVRALDQRTMIQSSSLSNLKGIAKPQNDLGFDEILVDVRSPERHARHVYKQVPSPGNDLLDLFSSPTTSFPRPTTDNSLDSLSTLFHPQPGLPRKTAPPAPQPPPKPEGSDQTTDSLIFF